MKKILLVLAVLAVSACTREQGNFEDFEQYAGYKIGYSCKDSYKEIVNQNYCEHAYHGD